jgi:hypothetical protein
MKTVRPMTGKSLGRQLREKGAEELGALFEEYIAEVYDHAALKTARSRSAMLEKVDKKWRGKKCSIVTMVLEAK